MPLSNARKVSAYVQSLDRWKGEPLYAALVETLRQHGIAGATAVRGREGYGASGEIHARAPLDLAEDVPVVVTFVDTPERIDAVLPTIAVMMAGQGTLVVNDVRIRSSAARP